MSVKAKFQCHEVRHVHQYDPDAVYAEVKLLPVHANSQENASWSKYTPHGEITLGITNPVAIEAFENGAEYLIDFTKVEPTS